jgi:transposase
MNAPAVGIDVAKNSLDVCLLVGEKRLHRQFSNAPEGHRALDRWLKKQAVPPLPVCLEATGQYGQAVTEYLYQQGHAISVVNPARIKAFGQSQLRRNKTDQADAQLIAQFCASQRPLRWTPPPASFRDLQALVRHLEDLQSMRQQEANRLQSGVTTALVLANLQEHLHFLDQQIEQVKQAIQEHIERHPALRRQQALLVSIPGIGLLTAAKLLGEIRAVGEFESARQLAAYAGLTPRNFVTGSSIHKKSRLSKTGNAHVRKILYLPAVSARRWNPIIRAFCQRLSGSGLTALQQIGAAMRKLLHLVYGILKSGKPFDPDYLHSPSAAS